MTATPFRLIAPPVTPFHADGLLNLDVIGRYAKRLSEMSVDGVFVAGSTGEGQSLSNDERMRLMQRWVEVGAPQGLEVIAQVGHNAQPDAVALAEHAQRIGADAVAASAPCYFKPASVEELIEFLVPVARAAGDLPFYFYEIPPMTNVRLPMVEFLRRAKPRMPNLVGLKYSNIDLAQMQQCLWLNDGEFEVLFGSDQQLLSAVIFGVQGAVGSTYNYAAPLYRRMLAAFEHGDLETARAEQRKSVELVELMAGYGFLAACKVVMGMLGVDCGPVRAPLANMTVEQERELVARVEASGLLETPTAAPSPA